MSRDPPKSALLRGLRALSKVMRAATVHAALIQGVLATLRAAARNSVHGYPFQRTPSRSHVWRGSSQEEEKSARARKERHSSRGLWRPVPPAGLRRAAPQACVCVWWWLWGMRALR